MRWPTESGYLIIGSNELGFPQIGRQIDKREERFLVKDYYQIFYVVTGNEIHILHIWDSRRDPSDLHLV
jgi:hypothetical protein